jgi:SAM-dependent methyltransferase
MTTAAAARTHWRALRDAASAPYRSAGRFAWRFARGKLGMDPVFRHMLRHGLIAPNARVLDIGCGQGLLASLLRACAAFHIEGRWPSGWAAAPTSVVVTGIELMERDVERARVALGEGAEFICGDMRHTPFPEVDAVVILDVLHYITVPEQDDVLARVRGALRPGGRLLLRIGDASASGGFRVSQWVDAIVTFVRGHRVAPQYGRTLTQWIARLESLGFDVKSEPMSEGTPFANVLLIAQAGVEPRPTFPAGDRQTRPSGEGPQ